MCSASSASSGPRSDGQPKNVVLYARVSSEKQAKKDLSIKAQLGALRAYAREKGWIVTAEYIDRAKSGRTMDRPAFKKMLVAVEHRDIDAVLVWKLDRLARNMRISADTDALFEANGVRVVSLHENIDDTPQGKLTARLFESFAEFYSNNLSQDIQRGIREVARRGFYPFSHAPIGYLREPIQEAGAMRYRLVPDEGYAEVIRRVFHCYVDGVTGPKIASQLNEEGVRTKSGKRWTAKRLYDILRNSAYCGDIIVGVRSVDASGRRRRGANQIAVRDVHEPLVSRSIFDQVQSILESRSRDYGKARRVSSPYLLSGLVRCGYCGSFMAGTSAKGGRYQYYTCGRYYREGKESCCGVRIRQNRLESFVVSQLRDVVLEESNLRDLIALINLDLGKRESDLDAKLDSCLRSLKGTRARLDRHYQALETGALAMTDVAPRIRELRDTVTRLEEEELRLIAARGQSDDLAVEASRVLELCENLRGTLRSGSFEEQRAFLGFLVKEIRVRREEVEIEYSLPRLTNGTEGLMPSVLHSFTPGGGGGSRTRVRNSLRSASTSLASRFDVGNLPPATRMHLPRAF